MSTQPRSLDSERVIRPASFAHVVLRTANLAESVRWYERVLGMQAVFANDFVAFMTFDAEHHRIAFIQTAVSGSAPPGAPGLDHFAYSFATLGELLSTYRRLDSQGIRPVWSINHGPTTSLYYEDPGGNRVELQVDNFESRAQLDAFMQTEVFAKNPIGVEFDADKLAARYEAGDPIDELVRQGAA